MTRNLERRSASGVLIGLLLLIGCETDLPATRPNVLLITLDTTRADFFGTYGAPGRGTPHFDALARGGELFRTAISTASVTPVAHASILTGLEPKGHGLRVLSAAGGYRLPTDVPTLATLLGEKGWSTGAVHSAFPVSGYFGLTRGIESVESFEARFDREEGGKHRWDVGRYQRRSDDATDLALEFVESAADPFFLWLHYWDPHDAELLPPPALLEDVPQGRSRRNRDLYAAELRYLDLQFGRLLRGLEERGRLENTIVAVTSDHGEGLGDHDWGVHRLLYQEQIHVPLILRIPGRSSPRPHAGDLARVTDVAPTLLEYAGVAGHDAMDGESLRGWIEENDGAPDRRPRAALGHVGRFAYADQVNGYDSNSNVAARRPFDRFLYCIMDEEWKLIYRPEFPERSELFHLPSDPGETENLYDEAPEERLRLERALARRGAWVTEPFAADASAPTEEQDAARAALESLGYTGSEGESEETAWSWTCPRHPSAEPDERLLCPECSDPLLLRARP